MGATNSLGLSTDELFGEAANEFFAAVARGEQPSLSDFAERYPEIAEHIRRTFPALLLVGTLSGDDEHMNEVLPGEQKTLGDFRLIREIGRGGMGTVFEAEQLSMGRRVALKVLPFAALVNETSLQRFRNEVRAAAALNHPHIVPVYSIGEERSIHFYAMQLVRGRTLADFIEELRKAGQSGCRDLSGKGPARHAGPTGSDAPTIDSAASLPATKRVEQGRISTVAESRPDAEGYRVAARLGIQAAEALQHAHDQGVLHRDIKPTNLLLDAEGKLYVTDFGLARIEADAGMTMTGDIVGTLRYMAPEQALAKRVVIDHRVDIYSLGATLYELLALQPAFGETDRSELLKQIAFEEPRLLRKLDRHIPAELETIVHKSMGKNPDERYQTAQQLADDLRASLEDRPIRAKPPTILDRAAKWSRRHVAAVWAVVAFLVVTSCVLASSAWFIMGSLRQEQAERQRAEKALGIARDAIRKSSTGLVQLMAGKSGTVGLGSITDTFLADGLKFYDSLLEVSGNNPDNVSGRAQYLITLSRHQAQDYQFKEASKNYDEAVGALRKLVEQFPDNKTYQIRLTVALTSRVQQLRAMGQLQEALRLARERVAFRQQLVDEEPENLARKDFLDEAMKDMMFCQFDSGDRKGALDTSDAIDSLCRELIRKDSKLLWYRHIRACGLIQRGSMLVEMDRLNEANEALQSGEEIERTIVAKLPTVTAYPEWLARGLGILAEVKLKQKKLDEALKFIEEAEQITRSKCVEDTDLLSEILFSKAKVLAQLGRTEDATQAIQQALKYTTASINVDLLNDAAWQLSTFPRDVCRNGQAAVRLAQKACELTDNQNPKFVNTLGAAYAETADFDNAVKWSEKAIEVTTVDRDRQTYRKELECFRQGKPWHEDSTP